MGRPRKTKTASAKRNNAVKSSKTKDMHKCILCEQEIKGLKNYVSHRRAGCAVTPTPKLNARVSPAVAAENVQPAMEIHGSNETTCLDRQDVRTKNFRCDVCNVEFKRKSSYKEHIDLGHSSVMFASSRLQQPNRNADMKSKTKPVLHRNTQACIEEPLERQLILERNDWTNLGEVSFLGDMKDKGRSTVATAGDDGDTQKAPNEGSSVIDSRDRVLSAEDHTPTTIPNCPLCGPIHEVGLSAHLFSQGHIEAYQAFVGRTLPPRFSPEELHMSAGESSHLSQEAIANHLPSTIAQEINTTAANIFVDSIPGMISTDTDISNHLRADSRDQMLGETLTEQNDLVVTDHVQDAAQEFEVYDETAGDGEALMSLSHNQQPSEGLHVYDDVEIPAEITDRQSGGATIVIIDGIRVLGFSSEEVIPPVQNVDDESSNADKHPLDASANLDIISTMDADNLSSSKGAIRESSANVIPFSPPNTPALTDTETIHLDAVQSAGYSADDTSAADEAKTGTSCCAAAGDADATAAAVAAESSSHQAAAEHPDSSPAGTERHIPQIQAVLDTAKYLEPERTFDATDATFVSETDTPPLLEEKGAGNEKGKDIPLIGTISFDFNGQRSVSASPVEPLIENEVLTTAQHSSVNPDTAARLHAIIFDGLTSSAPFAPYQCRPCHFTCNRLQDLRRHAGSRQHWLRSGAKRCSLCGADVITAEHYDDEVHRRCFGRRMSILAALPYSCSLCDAIFKLKVAAARHLRRHHRVVSAHFCEICGMVVPGDAASDHEQTHGLPYRCHRCDAALATQQEVEQHYRSSACQFRGSVKTGQHQCRHCHFRNDLKVNVLHHESVTHCPVQFREPRGLRSGGDGPRTMLPRFMCPECSTYVRKAALKSHLMKHTGEAPFHCLYCPRYFFVRSELDRHEASSHRRRRVVQARATAATYTGGAEPGQAARGRPSPAATAVAIKCQFCNEAFGSMLALRAHTRRQHRGQWRLCPLPDCDFSTTEDLLLARHVSKQHPHFRKLACNQCDFTTDVAGKLATHMNKHTGVKPYRCHYCEFATRLRAHLKRHLRVHTGARPYPCPYCVYTANNFENLRKHVIKSGQHKGLSLYMCKFCPSDRVFGTNLAREFKHHLRQHHSGEFPSSGALVTYVAGLYNRDVDVTATDQPIKHVYKPRSRPSKNRQSVALEPANLQTTSEQPTCQTAPIITTATTTTATATTTTATATTTTATATATTATATATASTTAATATTTSTDPADELTSASSREVNTTNILMTVMPAKRRYGAALSAGKVSRRRLPALAPRPPPPPPPPPPPADEAASASEPQQDDTVLDTITIKDDVHDIDYADDAEQLSLNLQIRAAADDTDATLGDFRNLQFTAQSLDSGWTRSGSRDEAEEEVDDPGALQSRPGPSRFQVPARALAPPALPQVFTCDSREEQPSVHQTMLIRSGEDGSDNDCVLLETNYPTEITVVRSEETGDCSSLLLSLLTELGTRHVMIPRQLIIQADDEPGCKGVNVEFTPGTDAAPDRVTLRKFY